MNAVLKEKEGENSDQKNVAFEGCSKAVKITLGANVTTIGNRACYNCGSLTSLEIPAKTTAGLLP